MRKPLIRLLLIGIYHRCVVCKGKEMDMNKKTCITSKDIDILCGTPEAGSVHNEKSSKNTFDHTQSGSEQTHSKWQSFKAKSKTIWNKAKSFASEIISGLVIVRSFLKVFSGIMKEFNKFKQSGKAFA